MKHSPKCTALINESGYFCGIALARLGAAEQERGIKPIQKQFGIVSNSEAEHHRRHNIQICPSNLVLVESPEDSLLVYSEYAADDFRRTVLKRPVNAHQRFPYDLSSDKGRIFSGAWSDRDFGVYVVGEGRKHLRTLFKAFQDLDGAILVDSRPFQPFFEASDWGSLCLMIPSRTPLSFWPDDLTCEEKLILLGY